MLYRSTSSLWQLLNCILLQNAWWFKTGSHNNQEKQNGKTCYVIYLVGARNWSIFVLVLLLGNGVTLLEARYGDGEGIEVENAEKYSAANAITSSGFRSNKNCMKSARRAFSSGWWLMYLAWSAFNSSCQEQEKTCSASLLHIYCEILCFAGH